MYEVCVRFDGRNDFPHDVELVASFDLESWFLKDYLDFQRGI